MVQYIFHYAHCLLQVQKFHNSFLHFYYNLVIGLELLTQSGQMSYRVGLNLAKMLWILYHLQILHEHILDLYLKVQLLLQVDHTCFVYFIV